MAATLLETARQYAAQQDFLAAAIVRYYAESSEVLRLLQFSDISGNAISYDVLESMPDVGFRAINEGYSESTAVWKKEMEALMIAGGDLDVDVALVSMFPESDLRTQQELFKVRALSLAWTTAFFKGMNSADGRQMNGLQVRLGDEENELVINGNGALSLTNLDRLISRVDNPTHLFMDEELKLKLQAASRNTDIAGFITFTPDEFGRQVVRYQGLPIIGLKNDNARRRILGFTESNPQGSGNNFTSVYCVAFRPMGLVGIQNKPIEVRRLGEINDKPAFRSRVEWYSSFAMFSNCAARLMGISDNPVVA
ncbi:MAG: hypothetical protein F6K50_02735 [Moorea sp. SIO3I7]|uniref:major capsid protein n=1 Tax=Moorena sp. SIO3I8 TaxID=2607833 RepID=UPI0013C1E6BB|nr:hypothetical protein [Moorena sp. SIO3I8]NEN94478.1 hypothetical protein [Moorena sp. SIO3I7]NEO04924.1 hypothetical protein [Moorena sp. SIO3I8]